VPDPKTDKSKIVVINAGSSSIKACVFDLAHGHSQESVAPIWRAQVNFQSAGAEITVHGLDGATTKQRFDNAKPDEGLRQLLSSMEQGMQPPIEDIAEIKAVGHRVVHGGEKHFDPTVISKDVLSELEQLVELAPDHEPANILGIKVAMEHFSGATQVAVFDTGFHHTMPEEAIVYALPYDWYEKERIRRYGFHGISHSFCLDRAAAMIGKNKADFSMINCHLGGGNSLCAIKSGASIMTTMGFTPLEGLVMGTRSGSIDPGIIFHLLRQSAYSAEDLDKVLNKASGLKGISGISDNMKEILDAAPTNRRAALAVEIYIRSLVANIASLVPLLGGLDVLAFAGGIGENASHIRREAGLRLAFLGVHIDDAKNNGCRTDADISSSPASVRTLVIHTNEELAIARECLKFVSVQSV
jgi:acetate kinase